MIKPRIEVASGMFSIPIDSRNCQEMSVVQYVLFVRFFVDLDFVFSLYLYSFSKGMNFVVWLAWWLLRSRHGLSMFLPALLPSLCPRAPFLPMVQIPKYDSCLADFWFLGYELLRCASAPGCPPKFL